MLDLLERNRVFRRRLARFDIEHRTRTEGLSPRVLTEPAHRQHQGLVQALGFDVDTVPDFARVAEADRACPDRHRRSRLSDSSFLR